MFGWKWLDGRLKDCRRFRELFLAIPRKNGKSTYLSCLSTFLLGFDKEIGGQIYCAGAKGEQADIIHDITSAMIDLNPLLGGKTGRYKAIKGLITDPKTHSKMISLAGVAKGQLGLNASVLIADEIASEDSWSEKLFDAVQTSMRQRQQPLTLMATTAGDNRQHWGYERIWRHARRVKENPEEQLTFLPAVWEPDEKQAADWKSIETWKAVNPNWETFPGGVDDYLADVAKCRSQPSYESTVKKFFLNIFVANEARWLSPDDWLRCIPDYEVTEDELKDCPVHLAFDVSSKQDMAAVAVLFELPGGKLGLRVYHFLPKTSNVLKDPAYRDRFERYEADPNCHLKITQRVGFDSDAVNDLITEIAGTYNVVGVAYDPWNSIETGKHCDNLGLQCVPVPPHFTKMSDPSTAFEQMVVRNDIWNLDNNPLLNWQAENVSIAYGGSNKEKNERMIRPVKPNGSNLQKIDGIYSAVLAVAHWQIEGGRQAIGPVVWG